ncbi:MAG TPA: hypothetical protein VFN15_03030 [Solirubrobacterales bacterium]|nr:hypothetical protein [Solirubrobacterales bacterium]
MAHAGLDPAAIDLTEIRGEDDAAAAGFPGSPTIRVNGEDVEPLPGDAPGGLTCRIYTRPGGQISPLPDPAAVRAALARASAGG